MTIQEAIKSGRPFRRPGEYWLKVETVNGCSDVVPVRREYGIIGRFVYDDVMATDWEVEPEVIEFECEWKRREDSSIIFPNCTTGTAERLLGKKTRVRIEVLE